MQVQFFNAKTEHSIRKNEMTHVILSRKMIFQTRR